MFSTLVHPGLNLSMVATTIYNPTISTIFGSTVTIPTIAAGKWATIAPPNRNILTGSCTQPVIAQIKDPIRDVVFVYPQIGCSSDKQDCCPYPFQANTDLWFCPESHVSMQVGDYRACCPVVGTTTYSLYYMGVGQQTPCFASIPNTLVPEHMPPPETLTVQTAILARSLPLAPPQSKAWIAGPVVGSVVFLVVLVAAIWFWCFRRGAQKKEQESDQPSAAGHIATNPVFSPVSPATCNQAVSPEVPLPLNVRPPPPQYDQANRSPYTAPEHNPTQHHELPALGRHPCGVEGQPPTSRDVVKN